MDCTIYAACKSVITGGKSSPDNFYFNGTTLKRENRGNREFLDLKFNTDTEACFGVFEGMGKAGSQASYLSAKLLGHFLDKKSPEVSRYNDMLRSFAMSSGRVVYNELAGYSSYSTVGVCYFKNDGLYVMSNATTKVFIQREAALKELSIENDSYLGQLPIQPEPLVVCGRIEIGDRIVICTDAICENISTDYFNEILSVEDNAASCVDRLLSEAVSQNIGTPATVMVFDVLDADGTPNHLLPDFFNANFAITPPAADRSKAYNDRFDDNSSKSSGSSKKSASGILSAIALILFAAAVIVIVITTLSSPGRDREATDSSTGMYNFDTENTAVSDEETTRKKDKEKTSSKSETSSVSDKEKTSESSATNKRNEDDTTQAARTTERSEDTTKRNSETSQTSTTENTTKETTSKDTTDEPVQTESRDIDQTDEPIFNPPDDDNDDE